MLWTVKKAARFLTLKPHQVYYLLMMGEIEAVKIGRIWRLTPEGVKEYDKRIIEKPNRRTSGNFIYQGSGGLLFSRISDDLRSDTQRKSAGMERRRRLLVHSTQRPQTVLLKEYKSLMQLELFTA
jgi:excisionase family DNA binding protein